MTPSNSPDARRRRLSPGPLVEVDGHLWVVDAIQPVAVVLDADTAQPIAQVAWPEVPPGPEPDRRVVLGAPDGLWVQQPGGPVVLVGAEGVRSAHYVSDLVLSAVTAHGAWCAPVRWTHDVAPSEDTPPQRDGSRDQLRPVRPDRPTTTVDVDGVVSSIRSLGQDLFVEIETGTWSRRPWGPSEWVLVRDTAWLRLGAADDVPPILNLAEHGHPAPPTSRSRVEWSGTVPAPTREGVGAPTWSVGRRTDSADHPHHVFVIVAEADTATERWRVRLGPRAAVGAAATASKVWVALEERSRPSGAPETWNLVRVEVDSGEIDEVAVSSDITEHCWPLGAPPVEADGYAAYWSERFSGIDAVWTHEDGTIKPLAEGLSDPHVQVVGAWPDATLHITFAWSLRPGLRLRRIVPLYDDLGRIVEPNYADINLMEDLETHNVPAAPDPGSDFLDL